ncbi:PREDICTED: toll-like receptor 1 isoform X2 [Rhagoletis zephyria]|uniref:toll-like receptor 1 isoform X2 n=1 Tax=Rhagoletis zephyria TaxID=28612 RepID=UPI000811761A|nr:PREDICTED: toll-like receptor 1 isoform X2 [Rhagoletis zephyria]
MNFGLKLALLILVIHFKLHGLHAATLIDRFKTAINDINNNNSDNINSSAYKRNYVAFDSSFNEVYNNSNKKIIDNISSTSAVKTITNTTTNKNKTHDWQINNKHLLPFLTNSSRNDNDFVGGTADNASSLINQTEPLYDSDGKVINGNSSANNFLSIDKILSDDSDTKNISHSSHNSHNNNSSSKDIEGSNINDKLNTLWQFISTDQQLSKQSTNVTKSLESSQFKSEEAPAYYQYNFTQNGGNQDAAAGKPPNNVTKGVKESQQTNSSEQIIPLDSEEQHTGKVIEPKTAVDDSVPLEQIEWELQSLRGNWNDLINSYEVNKIMQKYRSELNNSCIMDSIKSSIMWWVYSNGTLNHESCNNKNGEIFPAVKIYLDFSYKHIDDDDTLYNKTLENETRMGHSVVIFSAAHNNLTQVPFRTLTTMNTTLKYLTLKGNSFSSYNEEEQNEDEGISWATFPQIPYLLELDIGNCNIQLIAGEVFQNITGLRKLFMPHNKMLDIPSDTFQLLPHLEYLDLSFTNLLEIDYRTTHPTLNAVWHLVYGVKIHKDTFKNLNNLAYLDLSHTKVTRNSAMAFTYLGQSLKFMSLCYTSFPMVGNAFFKNTGLVGLDLSGNPYAAFNFIDDAFEGIADSLEYLFFEQSNLKDLDWLRPMEKLCILDLAGNNINSLSADDFAALENLHALDLSSNNIGNWYNQVFANNTDLRLLNLHNNNINQINYEMFKDFKHLDYLSLGENNFLCDCLLHDLVAVAEINNKKAECARALLKEKEKFPINDTQFGSMIPSILMQQYTKNLEKSSANIRKYKMGRRTTPSVRALGRKTYSILRSNAQEMDECDMIWSNSYGSGQINDSMFEFQLIDYAEDQYWCFNGTTRTQLMQLNCQSALIGGIAGDINKLTQILIGIICTLLGVTLLIVIVYLKRWHIYYYYSSLKSAALLSVATKKQVKQFNELAESDPNMVYDIFISYCESDRDWVLEELLPNVEEAGNISICLHERDFQIGVAILENIISCMDRSRALMLIISSNFLLSHWCQFEMHLAQHRIFEVSKEHLIIVFLEDIPRAKRPKTLQYLMEVKTYVKWPGAKGHEISPEQRKYFWKRLRHSLEPIGTSHAESLK